MKYYKLIPFLAFLYSIFMLVLVFKLEGFNGLKFLSFYMFFVAWILAWLVKKTYLNIETENIKKFKKTQIFFAFYFFLIFPMAFELNQRLAILFFDVEKHASQLKDAEVIMEGGVKANLNRFSGTAGFPVMEVVGSNKGGIPVCNLILLDNCEYGYMEGQRFNIKFVNGLGYPFKYNTLIFEIESNDFYRGVDYHVDIYQKNQLYVVYFILFIILPSLIITFLIPFIFYKRSKS